MKLLGNILWFLCGGIIGGLAWIIAGCIWCVTIVGIPVGLQCFKFASLAFWPFGKEVVYGNGTFSFLVNLIWILFFGWGMALGNIVLGCMWCITIVGIPFGKQFFKMARLSFMPFGANVLKMGNILCMNEAFPKSIALIKSLGYTVDSCNISEFVKAEAGLTCMCVPFLSND